MARFFSVQSEEDAARLAAGGPPWPTGLQRANLGPGLYAWDSPEQAERYRDLLLRHGAKDLLIVVYAIPDDELARLRTLDLTLLSDEEVYIWIDRHSHYGDALPHDEEYVIRHTEIGKEHYFAASVFGRLEESP